MADQKISDLTALTSASESDVLAIVNSGETKKITRANVLKVTDSLVSTSTVNPLSANQGKVLKDTLDTTTALIDYRGIRPWETAHAYVLNDVVFETTSIYKCASAHTSGTFLTDLGSGKWTQIGGGSSELGIIYVAKNGDDTLGDGSMGKPYLTVTRAMQDIVQATSQAEFDDPAKRYRCVKVGPGVYTESVALKVYPELVLDLSAGAEIVGNLTYDVSTLPYSPVNTGGSFALGKVCLLGTGMRNGYYATTDRFVNTGLTGNINITLKDSSVFTPIFQFMGVGVIGDFNVGQTTGGAHAQAHVWGSNIQGDYVTTGTANIYVYGNNCGATPATLGGLGGANGAVRLAHVTLCRITRTWVSTLASAGRWIGVDFRSGLSHAFPAGAHTIDMDPVSAASFNTNVPTKGGVSINLIAKASSVGNDSTVSGTTVKDALETLSGAITSENLWDRASTTISPHTAGDDISTTGNVSATNVNGTTALKVNNVDINTTGTLTNVAYKGQDNSFSVGQSITGDSSLNGAVVVNEAGADKDFRVEGDTDANLITADASTDRVGLGVAAPGEKLDVLGNVNVSSGSTYKINNVDINTAGTLSNVAYKGQDNSFSVGQTITGDSSFNGAVVVNEAGADKDMRVEGDTDTNLLVTDASTDRVGIGLAAPTEKVDVNGSVNVASGSTFKINGTDINTAGTLTNVAYENQENDFRGYLQTLSSEYIYASGVTPSATILGYGAYQKIMTQDTATVMYNIRSSDSQGPNLEFGRSRGTLASPTDVADGSTIWRINGNCWSGSGMQQTGGWISAEVDGTFVSGQKPPSRMRFLTNAANTALAEAMRITGTQLVGIGKTPVTYKLEVADDINVDSGKTYRINGIDINTTGTLTNVAYKAQDNNFTTIQTINDTGLTPALGTLAEKFRIFTTGDAVDFVRAYDGQYGPTMILLKTRGTAAVPTDVQTSDYFGGIAFRGWQNGAQRQSAFIGAQVDAAPSGNYPPTCVFITTSPGGATAAQERMRVTSAGLVGINKTPATYHLEVDGDVSLNTGHVYRINGVDINTTGTLTNVAYKGQDNNFSTGQTVTGTVQATTLYSTGDTKVDGYLATKPATSSLAAANTIPNTTSFRRVAGNGGAVTLTSTPTIADGGYDGQRMVIMGTDDTNTVTLQDEAQLANTGLQLSGAQDMTLGLYDTIELIYDSTLDKWCEISRSNN